MSNVPQSRRRALPSACSLPTNTLTLGLLAGLWTLPAHGLAYHEQGRLHDAASWHSQEFTRDWGLQAIGADAAYARGLSGRGVNLGIFDSGVDLRHSEFAGKDHRATRLADPGCTREKLPTELDDGCFFSNGDRAQVVYNDLPPEVLEALHYLVSIGDLSSDDLNDYLDMAGIEYEAHGTHVAGTMLANRDGAGTHGVAYGAALNTMRIFSNTYNFLPPVYKKTQSIEPGHFDTSTPTYKQMHAHNVRAINHSWNLSDRFANLDQLTAALAKHREGVGRSVAQGSLDFGLLQVWAAGNTITPNLSPEQAPMAGVIAMLPLAITGLEPYWLSVVNVDQNLTLSPGSFRCGYSMDWCVAAPGAAITSSVVGGDIDVNKWYDEDGEVNGFEVTGDRPVFAYETWSGTSMAAPHVTGALGLLMERFPYLDNPQIRDVLLTTAQDLGAPGVDDVYGWGLIDLKKAIDGPGQLRVDTRVQMDRRAGGAVVWQGGAWDDWRNDIDGPGRLNKDGAGWLRLSGNNRFAGATLNQGILEFDGTNHLTRDITVEGGLLRLNGALHGSALNVNGGIAQINGRVTDATTWVGAAGLLSGDGELSHTHVQGTLMPGSEYRALTVNGDYQQQAGSTLIARPGPNPGLPALQVTGAAHLQGGTLRLAPAPNVFALGQRYRVLQADAGINGRFDALDHQAFSPFLGFTQRQEADQLSVDVSRGLPLVSAASSANQRATAEAADALPMSASLAQRLTSLFPEPAQQALDQLSGELYASTQSVLLENSHVIRDAALTRASGLSPSGLWVQALNQNGRLDGDGNAAKVSHSNTGVMIGADHEFDQGTRAGLLFANSQGRVNTGNTGKASLDTVQFGLHAGHSWNAFGLYGGLAYARNTIQSKRRVSFADIDEGLSANYLSHTRQLFIEGNYRLNYDAWALQPYVQLAHVRVRNDGFSERGGQSALQGSKTSSAVNLSTAGVRFNLDLSQRQIGPSWLSFNAGLAYTHASGDLQPTTQVAWQGASSQRIAGAPLSSTVQLDLGAVARLSRGSTLSLNLNDQRSKRSREQGVTAQYQYTF